MCKWGLRLACWSNMYCMYVQYVCMPHSTLSIPCQKQSLMKAHLSLVQGDPIGVVSHRGPIRTAIEHPCVQTGLRILKLATTKLQHFQGFLLTLQH
jgi:hypothetical protein